MIRLSFIVPTCGRASLYEVLHEAWKQGLTKQDEVLVIGDGPQPDAKRITTFFAGLLNIRYEETEPTNCVGMFQRNYAMTIASGSHLFFFDDDDKLAPGAIQAIRRHVSSSPERLHMFRIKAVAKRLSWDIIWKEASVREANVGSPTMIAPNDPKKLGTWGSRYAGDFDFVDSTCRLHEQPPIWHEEVIAEIR